MRCDHPNRFGVFASLPLPDIEGSLREIAYALDELKSEGIGLLTNYDGKYPGDPAFAPVFEELNRRKAVVYFHPAQAPCCAAHGIGVPAATLDFPFDTTKAITSMLFAGTFARCRDIRFIFSHAGGTVPFLAERIARLQVRPEFKAAVPDGVMFELKRLFFDTALSANELAFSALLKLVAPDQVLFGSDYPVRAGNHDDRDREGAGRTRPARRGAAGDRAHQCAETARRLGASAARSFRNELDAEPAMRARDARDMGRREMRRKQQRALLGAMLQRPPARRARHVGDFAEARIPVGLVDLDRVVTDVAAEQRPCRRDPPDAAPHAPAYGPGAGFTSSRSSIACSPSSSTDWPLWITGSTLSSYISARPGFFARRSPMLGSKCSFSVRENR